MQEASGEQRPFAVFDIDGTLIRWQLYHALADEMVRRSMIDPEQFEAVRESRAGFWLETAARDLRYGARMLGRNPCFTAIALLTLAGFADGISAFCRSTINQTVTADALRGRMSAVYSMVVTTGRRLEQADLDGRRKEPHRSLREARQTKSRSL